MKTHCDRCGKDCRVMTFGFIEFVPSDRLVEVKKFYQVIGVTHICDKCTFTANKFINYFGKKSPQDLKSLRDFLVSGAVSSKAIDKVYSQLMNGGYYEAFPTHKVNK